MPQLQTKSGNYGNNLQFLPSALAWLEDCKVPSCAEEVRCDSCAFGSVHLKPFHFLGINISLELLSQRCSGDHQHVRIEGAYTKASATYVENLVEALADRFHEAMLEVQGRRNQDLSLQVAGLENQLVNEVAVASKWEVDSSWTFKKQSHINILEEASVLRLVTFLSSFCQPLPVSALVDSFVIRGAAAKGRSSSRALSTILWRVGAFSIAAIYLTLPYVPTR